MSEAKRGRGRPRKNTITNIDNSSQLSDETVTEIVKQKKKYPKKSEAKKEHHAPGEMSKMIVNAMALQKMGKVDMTNPDAVNQRVDEYLTYCIKHDMKPTVESMALAFGTNRMTLWRWKEGVESSHVPEASREALRRGYDMMNQLLSQALVDGAINPIAAFFLLKNNHGYKDQTDVVVSAANPYENANPGDVRGKYIEGMQDELTINADGEVK